MRFIKDLSEIEAAPDQLLGVSPTLLIDQRKIDLFAEATGDDQWIHVDQVASSKSVYGGTIAHGLLALSSVVKLETLTYQIGNVKTRLNYGLDRLRFMTPLTVNSEIFAEIYSKKVERVDANAKHFKEVTVFAKGEERPILKANTITYLVLE